MARAAERKPMFHVRADGLFWSVHGVDAPEDGFPIYKQESLSVAEACASHLNNVWSEGTGPRRSE